MNRSAIAFAAYAALAVAMTWPLAAGVGSDVPGDLGDSLLNMWILGWGAEHVPGLLTGQTSATAYWNANIFHPEPLALAFSEHLLGEVLQILPVYWLTGNLILCYNLLFLSSFALSGLAMFLLVRDLLSDSADVRPAASRVGAGARDLDPGVRDLDSGAWSLRPEAWTAAAFVAGLIFAFLPFRIAQVAHIQSLQAQWMPFALYGFRRFIVRGNTGALAGGTAALIMQNWSNGYYLIFFAPFVPVFVVHQMWTAGRLRDIRAWLSMLLAGAIVSAATVPMLLPYLEAQRVHGFERSIGEVIRFSADVYSYLTAPEALRLWGDVLQAYPKAEGELFFGAIPWLLVAIAIAHLFSHYTRQAPEFLEVPRPRRAGLRSAVWLLSVVIAVQSAGLVAIVFTGGFVTSFAGVPIRATNAARIVIGIVIATAILLAISRAARERVRVATRSPITLAVVLMVLAIWLSLGPMPQSHGRTLQGLGLYGFLYDHVPGFAGLRVPARYAMIAAVFLCIAAGFGAAVTARLGTALAAAVGVAFLAEAAFAPMTVNATWGDTAIHPPARVEPAADAPAVYHTLAGMPDDTVVAEFPFGDPAWELRYVYYSTVHWKRLLNGYSGGFPQSYKVRVALLQQVRENPDTAWRALRDAGTTHVVVHQRAMTPEDATYITRWLENHFAVEIARFDDDLLFDISGVWPPPL